MTALWIVLGVVLFLVLLTWIPVNVDVGFRQEFTVTLHYLFLRFRLFPGKEKEQPPREEPKKEGGAGKIKEILGRTGFAGFLQSLFQLVKLLASSGKRLVSRFRLKRFDLYLCLAGGEDAAQAAIQYGQLSGAVYSACGFLFGLTGCKRRAVTVDLDYESRENKVEFSARISLRPAHVIKEGVSLLIKGLPVLRKLIGTGSKKKERRASSNE